MSDSSTSLPTTRGELRAARGAFVFIPEGTDRYLRVELEAPPPEGFRSSPAALTLAQRAKATLESARLVPGVEPEHGVPERIRGDVQGTAPGGLVVDCGPFAILVQTADRRRGRVLCEMEGPLFGTALRLEG